MGVRVAHVITGLEVGGAQMMLCKLLSALDRGAFEPLVVSLVVPGPMAESFRDLGVPVASLDLPRGRPDPRALVRLVRRLRAFRPDLVQTWMYHADLFGALVRPWLSISAPRPALVWNIRQSDLDPRMTRRSTRLVARVDAWLSWRGPLLGPDRIICCSSRARTVHAALGYRDERITVIGNGFDLEAFRPNPAVRAGLRGELGLTKATPLVGLVGRFDPQKDLPTFIAAAARVHGARPDCRFLLCGTGMDAANPTLAGWLADAGLRDATALLGPRADMANVYPALDLLCLASAYGEGFPNVLGEAMACAVPAVVTDVGDSGLIVGDTGLTVTPRDPVALADALLALLAEDAAARMRRGQAARARIGEQYGLSRIAQLYGVLYQSLVRGST